MELVYNPYKEKITYLYSAVNYFGDHEFREKRPIKDQFYPKKLTKKRPILHTFYRKRDLSRK